MGESPEWGEGRGVVAVLGGPRGGLGGPRVGGGDVPEPILYCKNLLIMIKLGHPYRRS